MTDPVDTTLATYQATAQRYVDAGEPPGPALTALLDALAARVPGGSVLEVGSGPGWDAAHLEARDVLVTRTDATAAFVDRLRAQGHDARLLDVRHDDLGGPYDAVLAQAVLLHLDRDQLLTFLVRARQVARVLALTLEEGDGGAWSTDKLDAPRWFTYWREPALRQALTRSGWSVESLDHVQGRHEPWLHVLAVHGGS